MLRKCITETGSATSTFLVFTINVNPFYDRNVMYFYMKQEKIFLLGIFVLFSRTNI